MKQEWLYWALGIAIGIFVLFIWPSTSTYDGDGTVSLFPEGADAKNYRLDAQITVTEHDNGWFRKNYTYKVTRADWPNGGYETFNDCTVQKDSRSDCVDQDNRTYTVEVTSAPEPPDNSDTGN